MATSLTAIALVGSLALLRDGMEMSDTIDKRLLMTNYAVSKLEEHLAIVANGWTTGGDSGDFAADGHANIRFSVSRSDDGSDGGISDRLMHVQVTTYHDADGDDVLDADEDQCIYRTKIGKFATYEAL
ncbi:MAG: hypothetical protein ACR2NM_06590 [Bythopirellula sp.]